LAGSDNISGTGTIDAEGNVGPIGGIRQKMYTALRAGSTWFLAPGSNCDEVVDHIPDGLHVTKVSTLTDAIKALEVISSGGDTASLPICTK
jgi:PDZ domain-containing protein